MEDIKVVSYGTIVPAVEKQENLSMEKRKTWKFDNVLMLVFGSLVIFMTNQLTTLLVGFFPSYAVEHFHASSLEISTIFSLYPISIMLASPLASHCCDMCGKETVLCVGLFVTGVSTLAFGYSVNPRALIGYRVLQGVGSGASVVGMVTTIAEYFPIDLGHAVGIQELIVAAAFITAPPIGSVIYAHGGYEMPFIVAGLSQLSLLLFFPFVFMNYVPQTRTKYHGVRSLKEPVAWFDVLNRTSIMCFVTITAAMSSFGFIDPNLGSHLQQVLGIQHTYVGVGFAVSALVYCIFGTLYLNYSDKCGCKLVISSGLLMLSMGFFLLGPPPFLYSWFISPTVVWNTQLLSLILIGCGASLAIAPCVPLALLSVAHLENRMTVHRLVGFLAASIYLGQGIGPFIAYVLMWILPSTHSPNCIELSPSTVTQCYSSLPWACVVYSLMLATLFVFTVFTLPSGQKLYDAYMFTKAMSIQRQVCDYGQFVFTDDDPDSEEFE